MELLTRRGRLRDAERRVLALTIAVGALQAERDQLKQDLTVSEDNRCYWQDVAHNLRSENEQIRTTLNGALQASQAYSAEVADLRRRLAAAEQAHANVCRSYGALEENFERQRDELQHATSIINHVADLTKGWWWADDKPDLDVLRTVIRDFETRNAPPPDHDEPDDLPF